MWGRKGWGEARRQGEGWSPKGWGDKEVEPDKGWGGAGQGMVPGRTRDGAGPEGVERQGGKLGEEWTSLSAGRGWEGGL